MTPQDKITHIVINSELLLNRLQDSVAEKMFKQALKNKAKNFIEELKTVERDWYDKFFDQKLLNSFTRNYMPYIEPKATFGYGSEISKIIKERFPYLSPREKVQMAEKL